MKKVILSIILFLICGNLFSQIAESVHCDLKYEIISSGKTTKFKFICLIPKDIEKVQKVNSISYSIQPDKIFDKNGNRYAQFILKDLDKKEEILISAELSLYINDLATNLKNEGVLNKSISDFLNGEKYIEKEDEVIKSKALELKSSEEEQTVKNIFTFTNEKIKYAGYNPGDVGAVKALNLMQGDCSEFSDLFVALCRANDIPARVVEGITTDYKNTPKHAWVEVYLSKYGWVGFDPTPGNQSTFETMKNKYIRLSTVRNDEVLNHYHSWAYWYWGAPIEVRESVEIEK